MLAAPTFRLAFDGLKAYLKLRRRLRPTRKAQVAKRKAEAAGAAPPPKVDRKALIAYHLGTATTDAQFRRRYRLPKGVFLSLADKVREHWTSKVQSKFARLSYAEEGFTSKVRLAITLRFLAGASYVDLLDVWGIPASDPKKIYRIVYHIVDAVNAVLQLPGVPFGNKEDAVRVSQSFSRLTQNKFVGAIGAVDGFLLALHDPKSAVKDSAHYYSRKGFFALNLQVVCDGHRRVLWASCNSPGATHDSRAFERSDLFTACSTSEMMKEWGFFLVGDSAYVSAPWMVTPFSGATANTVEDAFNYYQSRTRISIECCFGELTQRWGFLWRPSRLSLNRTVAIVNALFRLHNLCVEDRASDVIAESAQDLGLSYGDADNFGAVAERVPAKRAKGGDKKCMVRANLAKKLWDAGLRRKLNQGVVKNASGQYMRVHELNADGDFDAA